MPKKPTGNIPTIGISFSSGKITDLNIRSMRFALDKDEIEKQIVNLFVSTTKKSGFIFLEVPKQNKQDDFDFTLTLPGSNINLELTEFVVRRQEIPYQSSKTTRTCGELHDAFMKTINNKIDKANKRLERLKASKKEILPIHLLCYTTHADYNIDNVVVALIQHTLITYLHPFENIFLLQPISNEYAEIRVLYPYNGDVIDKETLVKLRENKLVNIL